MERNHPQLWERPSLAMTAPHRRKPALGFHPLTIHRWADFEALFGERGACGGLLVHALATEAVGF